MPWYRVWVIDRENRCTCMGGENCTSFRIAEGMAFFYDSYDVCVFAVPQSRVFEIEVMDYVPKHPERTKRS